MVSYLEIPEHPSHCLSTIYLDITYDIYDIYNICVIYNIYTT